MKKRILNVLIGCILLLLLLLITIKMIDILHFNCIYKKLFNIYCAGCGTTRMIKCILNLEFKEAFMYNPLIFILLILFLIYLIYRAKILNEFNNCISKVSLEGTGSPFAMR